jgi:hypothetical protein
LEVTVPSKAFVVSLRRARLLNEFRRPSLRKLGTGLR